MPRPVLVGVLALQGDFARHEAAWRRAGAEARPVRSALDLAGIDALSMPGGESSTMLRLLEVTGFRSALDAFVRAQPVFATCAGAILLARHVDRLPAPPLGAMDVDVARNAYGRQVDSFEADLSAPVLGKDATVRGVFIRAPRFTRLGEGVEVLVRRGEEPVGVREGSRVALAFHPELTDDVRLFRWFLDTVVAAPHPAANAATAGGRA
jgi:5'-phosphate synthase pdxT subunit